MHGWVQKVENGRELAREGLDGRYTVLLCAVFQGNRRVAEVYGVSFSKMRKNNGFVLGSPIVLCFSLMRVFDPHCFHFYLLNFAMVMWKE
jgi:hypothetical protein